MPSIRRSQLLIALAVLAVAVGLFFLVRALSGGESVAAPNPSEAGNGSPGGPNGAQPEPFKVKVARSRGISIDSSNLYGRKAPAQPAVVKAATTRAVAQLERYLNSQFIRGGARFSAAPVRKLLTLEAFKGLSKADRAALGVAALEKPAGGGKSQANARSLVLHRGDEALSVTLEYRANVKLLVDAKPQRLIQEGAVVFARGPAGWRADMADVRLSLPPPTKRDRAEKSK